MVWIAGGINLSTKIQEMRVVFWFRTCSIIQNHQKQVKSKKISVFYQLFTFLSLDLNLQAQKYPLYALCLCVKPLYASVPRVYPSTPTALRVYLPNLGISNVFV